MGNRCARCGCSGITGGTRSKLYPGFHRQLPWWAGLDDVLIRLGTPSETTELLLSASLEGERIVIEFSGKLESAESLQGPWQWMEGATSPFSEPATQKMQYYRVVP